MKFQSKIVIATISAILTFAGQTPEPSPMSQEKVQFKKPHIIDQEMIEIVENNANEVIKIKKEADVKKEKEAAKKAKEKKLKDFHKKHGYYKQVLNNGKEIVFTNVGVIYEKGIRYTYYSSRVLHHYQTEEWILGADGIYRDKDGYIIVASSDHPKGKKVHTPFGKGIVRDAGCASGTIDIYTAF